MRLDLASPGRTVAENATLAERAEQRGWGGFWVAETNTWDAMGLCASVAGRLRTGRFGTAIVPMQTRDPLLLAMSAATLEQVAPGGFVLGLGVSTPIIIQDWHATEWGSSPLGLARECVGLVRRFLDGERVSTDAGRWRYRRAQLARPPERRVPIYLAALNQRMLELAGEIADGVILNFVSVGDVAVARRHLQAGAERAGRSLDDFEIMVFFRASAVDDYGEARERYRQELLTYMMAPVYQRMFAREGHADACAEVERLWRKRERAQALAAVPDALIQERTLIGSPADIEARLSSYEAAGVHSSMVFPVAIPGRDYVEDCTRSLHAVR